MQVSSSEGYDDDDYEEEDYEEEDVGRAGGAAGKRAHSKTIDPGWQKTAAANPPTVKEFTEPSGPTQPLPPSSSPLAFFEQMFGSSFFEDLAEATNLNAAAKCPPVVDAENGPYATSDADWYPTSPVEMRAFFAVNMRMNISEFFQDEDFWSEDPVLQVSYVASIMSQLRFEKLCQYLHCSVPHDKDPNDKLAKVRSHITLCRKQFRDCFKPSQDVLIDQAMIRFDGRLGWNRYLPRRPTKYGIKLWCLTDAVTGYVQAFHIWNGEEDVGSDGVKLSHKVAMELTQDYTRANRRVFAAEYFTTVGLAKELLRADTYLCGAASTGSEDFPTGLMTKRLKRKKSEKWTSEDGTVLMCKWHKTNSMYVVATGDTGVDVVLTGRHNHQSVSRVMPQCVARYNKVMCGIDHLDEPLYVGQSGRRWWKYLFWSLVEFGIINAFVLWRECNRPMPKSNRIFTTWEFKTKLIEALAKSFIALHDDDIDDVDPPGERSLHRG